MLTPLMIFSAQYLYLVIIGIALVYLLLTPKHIKKEMIVFSIISLPVTFLLGKLASKLYYSPRPFVVQHITPLIKHAPTNGFPSDHALISFAIAALVFIFNKKLGILLSLLALIVGIGRIYVHVHSPVDVIGSIGIAFVVAVLVYFGLQSVLRR